MKVSELLRGGRYRYSRTMAEFTSREGVRWSLIDLPTHEYVILKGDEVYRRNANWDMFDDLEKKEGRYGLQKKL